MKQDSRMKRKGFTLVELLISISIIGILSVVLTISLSNTQKNSRDQRRIADLKAIQNAAELYFLLKGSYPTSKSTPWKVNSQVVLQEFPVGPKGTSETYTYTVSGGQYCACSSTMESGKYGNAALIQAPCDFQSVGTNYCVGNQQ